MRELSEVRPEERAALAADVKRLLDEPAVLRMLAMLERNAMRLLIAAPITDGDEMRARLIAAKMAMNMRHKLMELGQPDPKG
jgi:hypothetical protein